VSASAARILDRAQTEKALHAQVLELAELSGWMVLWSDAPAPRCPHCESYVPPYRVAGHLDLELVRGPVLLHMELKSAKGRLTPQQAITLELLQGVERIEAMVVRPEDWDSRIVPVLREGQR